MYSVFFIQSGIKNIYATASSTHKACFFANFKTIDTFSADKIVKT